MTERPANYRRSRVEQRDPGLGKGEPQALSGDELEAVADEVDALCKRRGVAFSLTLIARRRGATAATPAEKRYHMSGRFDGPALTVMIGLMATAHNIIETIADVDRQAAFYIRTEFIKLLAFGAEKETNDGERQEES